MDIGRIFAISIRVLTTEQRIAHNIGEPNDRVQRRAQFMADICKKFRLFQIRLFGPVAMQTQFHLALTQPQFGDDLIGYIRAGPPVSLEFSIIIPNRFAAERYIANLTIG